MKNLEDIAMIHKKTILSSHANVSFLAKGEERKLFGTNTPRVVQRRAKSFKSPPKAYSTAHSIANLLYPKNFLEYIASGIEKSESGHSIDTFSRRVKLSRNSQKMIEDSYEKNREPKIDQNLETKLESARDLARKIFDETGIAVVNTSYRNVGFTPARNPVFFEISYIDLQKLRKHVKSMPEEKSGERLRKKQALALLKALEKVGGRNKRVLAH